MKTPLKCGLVLPKRATTCEPAICGLALRMAQPKWLRGALPQRASRAADG